MSDGTEKRSYLVEKVLKEQRRLEQHVQRSDAETVEAETEQPAEKVAREIAGEPSAEPGIEERAEEATTPEDVLFEEAVTTVPELHRGQILTGRIVQVRSDGVMVDIGGKAEGFIPLVEWGGDMQSEAKVGDEVEVYVLRIEEEDEEHEGLVYLSKRRADYERIWKRIEEAYENGEILKAMVKDRVRGGLVVDLGIDGFVPASLVHIGRRRRLENFIGRTIKVKIIELDRNRRRVVCSNITALEEERQRLREETLKRIKVGEVLEGTVRRIRDFGAFIDLGGIEGLLHVSEMSWTRIEHPSEVVKEGDRVQVVILDFDPESERISLGMRQLLPDPWKTAEQDYPVGARVRGKVTRIVPAGAFVRMPSGIEGIIPISEVAQRRVAKVSDVLSVGQEVEAKVIQVSGTQRRLVLSLRQVAQEHERQQLREFIKHQTVPEVTLGDVFGDKLDQIATGGKGSRSAEEKTQAQEDKGKAE